MITKPLRRDFIGEELRRLVYEQQTDRPLRIAPERELARLYNVSRLSLRAAIRSLIEEGLLFQKQGSGTCIMPRSRLEEVHLFIAPDIKPQDPFYGEFLNCLSGHLRTRSAQLKVVDLQKTNHTTHQEPLIVMGLTDDGTIHRLQSLYRHIVCTQYYPDSLEITQVYFDDYKIGYQAGKILKERGYRRILHLAGPDMYPAAAERRKGFLQSLRDLPEGVQVAEGKMNWASGYQLGDTVIELAGTGEPLAVFAANDWMAAGLIHRLTEKDIPVPGRVAIIGCDDIHLASEIRPALSTFRWDMDGLIEEVFTQLDSLVRLKSAMHKRILLPAAFVERESLDRRVNEQG